MTTFDYDRCAGEYGRHRRVHPEVLRRLLLDGGLTRDSRVLELGCGTGNYTAAIHKAAGCACWGIDPSDAMLRKAATQCPTARLHVGRAERLDFPAEAFDLVFSVDVIHHVADRPACFREAHRVLAPGGKICTVTDSEEIIRTRIPLARYFPETVDVDLQRYSRLDDLLELMTFEGFGGFDLAFVEHAYRLEDIEGFRDKAFSSLHLIAPEAFERGLRRLEEDLRRGPISCLSRYAMLWGRKGMSSWPREAGPWKARTGGVKVKRRSRMGRVGPPRGHQIALQPVFFLHLLSRPLLALRRCSSDVGLPAPGDLPELGVRPRRSFRRPRIASSRHEFPFQTASRSAWRL